MLRDLNWISRHVCVSGCESLSLVVSTGGGREARFCAPWMWISWHGRHSLILTSILSLDFPFFSAFFSFVPARPGFLFILYA